MFSLRADSLFPRRVRHNRKPSFDLFIQSKGEEKIWIIQTNPNNVFQGTATRVSR